MTNKTKIQIALLITFLTAFTALVFSKMGFKHGLVFLSVEAAIAGIYYYAIPDDKSKSKQVEQAS
ncbi:MAG: hypothetical protein C9356_20315 [Oleiphilus sp.]|nr:MAG: hypothetical protein C9356_20315 [Oleiphilus sp.]